MPPRPAPVAGWRSRAEARFVGRQPPAACNTGTLLRRRWSADNKARILRRRWRHLQQGPDGRRGGGRRAARLGLSLIHI